MWKEAFDSHKEAQEAAGLVLEGMWRNADDASVVFFLFTVADMDRARAFISAEPAEDALEKYGVMNGNIWFVEQRPGSQRVSHAALMPLCRQRVFLLDCGFGEAYCVVTLFIPYGI